MTEAPAADWIIGSAELKVPVAGLYQRAPMSAWRVWGSVQSPWKPMVDGLPALART